MREQCPNCGSTDLVLTNGTYSTGCGCLGLLLFGWVGLLLGLLGLGNYELVCKHCGSRWPVGRPGQASKGGAGIGCLVIIIIILVLAAAGCRTTLPPPQLPGAWELKNSQTTPPITLFIGKNGSFYGFGGVNRYFGQLSVPFDQGKFAIDGTPGVTMMAGPYLNQEQNYIKTLTTADRWVINESNELELYSKNKKTAVFINKPELDPTK